MSEQNSVARGHKPQRIAISVAGHLLAMSTLYVAFLSLFFTERSVGLLEIGLQDELMQADVVGPMVLLFGLAGCVWALMFIIYQLFRSHAQAPKKVSLKKARGTIVTETLVVLPVFFLLTFGLAQMALNSIAGILTTLASYEAARTLAVWAVEEDNNRAPGGTVSRNHIRERARLAAASVIAPATPELRSGLQGCNEGSALPNMRAGMAGTMLSSAVSPQISIGAMSEGFGKSTFARRGPNKLTLAYCNTDVAWTNVDSDPVSISRSQFTATVRYHHPAVMPLIGPIFTKSYGAGNWQTNYVSTMEKSYRYTTYLTPNVDLPFDEWYAPL